VDLALEDVQNFLHNEGGQVSVSIFSRALSQWANSPKKQSVGVLF